MKQVCHNYTSISLCHPLPSFSFTKLLCSAIIIILLTSPQAAGITYSSSIISETTYTDCSDSSSSTLSDNKWTQSIYETSLSTFDSQCVTTCGAAGSILGGFSPTKALTRRFFITKDHSIARIQGSFIKIDGWSLGQQLIIEANNSIVYTWEYTGDEVSDTNLCDYSLINTNDHIESFDVSIAHTSNLVIIKIYSLNSNSESISAWALQSFNLSIESPSSTFSDITGLSLILETNPSLPEVEVMPYFRIIFSRQLATLLKATDFSIEIQDIDAKQFTTSISQIDAVTYQVTFTSAGYSTFYGQIMQVIFSEPIRDNTGMALSNLENEAIVSSYYNYSSIEITMMKTFKNSIKYAAIIIVVLMAILTLGFNRFNWLLYCTDIGQLLYLSNFINVTFPWNARFVLQACQMFHLKSGTSSIFFDSMIAQKDIDEQRPFYQQLRDLGMTSLFISNAGNLVIMVLAILGVFIFLSLLSKSTRCVKFETQQKIKQILQERFKWRLFLACGYFIYSSILFAGLVQVLTISMTSFIQIISLILAVMSIMFAIFTPVWLYRLLSKNSRNIQNESSNGFSDINLKYGIIWNDFRLSNQTRDTLLPTSLEIIKKSSSKTGIFNPRQFYFLLLLRRFFYTIIIVFFQFNANLQIAMLNICNVTVIFAVVFFMPFTTRRNNYKVIATELILVAQYMIIQSYQNEQEDQSSKLLRGWYIVTGTVAIVLIQLVYLSLDIYEALSAFYEEWANPKNHMSLSAVTTTILGKSQTFAKAQEKAPLLLEETRINNKQEQTVKFERTKSRRKTDNLESSQNTPNKSNKENKSPEKREIASSTQLSKQYTHYSQKVRESISTAIGEGGSHIFKHDSLQTRQGLSVELDAQQNPQNTQPQTNKVSETAGSIGNQQALNEKEAIQSEDEFVQDNGQFETYGIKTSPTITGTAFTSSTSLVIPPILLHHTQQRQHPLFSHRQSKFHTQNDVEAQASPQQSERFSGNLLSPSTNRNLEIPSLTNISQKLSDDERIQMKTQPIGGIASSMSSITDSFEFRPRNPSIKILNSEDIAPKNDDNIEQESEHNSVVEEEYLKPPVRFFNQFSKLNGIIHEMPGEENGSIMGMSQNLVQDSPLDINPDRRRMMMSALMKMQLNPGGTPQNAGQSRQSGDIDEIDEESLEIQKSVILSESSDEKEVQQQPEEEADEDKQSPDSPQRKLSLTTQSLKIISEEATSNENTQSPTRKRKTPLTSSPLKSLVHLENPQP